MEANVRFTHALLIIVVMLLCEIDAGHAWWWPLHFLWFMAVCLLFAAMPGLTKWYEQRKNQ